MRAQGGVDIRMIIRADGCPDPRRYNTPSVQEIAVLLPGGGYSEGVVKRDIMLHAHRGSLKRITEIHCVNDSPYYVRILRHYGKRISVLFLMTFCIVLENLCPISKLMSTYLMLH